MGRQTLRELMPELDRRRFVIDAAQAALLIVPLARGRWWRLPADATPGPVRELARALRGTVVARGANGYAAARRLFNTRFDTVSPLAIAYCENPEDVQKAVRWAHRHRVRIAPRSGGHSYVGSSTSPGLVVDVSRIRSVTVRPGSRTATIGAGAQLVDVYESLSTRGLTIPGGTCPTLGIAGLTLGGGVGFSARKLGTTCDNLTELLLVSAAGTLLVCNADEHADLFWACRGGGGGNFGIATRLTFRTTPVETVSWYTIEWPWEQAKLALAAWQAWAPHAPDELFSVCDARATDDTGAASRPRITSSGQFYGAKAALQTLVRPLLDAGQPARAVFGEGPYMRAAKMWAGCPGTVDACHLPWQRPTGALERWTFTAKSDYVARPLPQAALAAIVHWLDLRQADPRLARGKILLDAYGGAINRVRPGATAFVHRDALFSCQYLAWWEADDPPAVAAANRRWIRGFHTAMRPFVSGFAYQNYLDLDLADWQRAYYGSNYERLTRTKGKYDAENVFRFAQSIRPRR